MADLTEEEDKELKGTDIGRPESVGIRRDFSVIHSKQLKKNHLFLGPARFVNVSAQPPLLPSAVHLANTSSTFVSIISPPASSLLHVVHHSNAASYSMIVTTMLNCFAKGGTSRFGSSST